MPLFMVKKEVSKWIRNGRKTIELRDLELSKTDVSSKILSVLLFSSGKSRTIFRKSLNVSTRIVAFPKHCREGYVPC
jgi:hypothetical protein